MQETPRQHGWHPSPVWSPPGRFWLVWPAATGDRDHDDAARDDCLGLAELLSDQAPVSIICPPGLVAECALRSPAGVAALAAEHDGTPLGFHAPVWLADGDGLLAAAIVRSPLSRLMAERAGVVLLDAPPGFPLVLESDGEGTALVSAPAIDQVAVTETLLHDWLGMEKMVWLNAPNPACPALGIRFVAPTVVAVTMERDERHPNFVPRALIRDTLLAVTDGRGRKLIVLELPAAKRKDCSYADCLVAGSHVVVPEFEDGRGTEAFGVVTAALPSCQVTAFPASWIAPMGGGLGAAVVVQPRK